MDEIKTTILIVGDEIILLAVLAVALRRAGYAVLGAANGAEALTLARTASRVDLLIANYSLPGMNAEELFHALQKSNPSLRAICMTNLADVGGRFVKLGQAFVTRPVNIDALLDEVQRSTAAPTVLLVEDEEGLRMLWTSFLERNHFKVIGAENGFEGLKLYSQHQDKIALVITDHQMPVMNGAIMTQQIREMRPDAKVLTVSSNTAITYPDGVEHLPKPFPLDHLLSKVRMLCR